MLMLGAWYITALAVAFVLVCLFMILVILIQRPRGGGLAGAFGGSGGSAQAAFGAKTGDVLTWFTVACFVLFLCLAMGLTWTINPESTSSEPQNSIDTTTPEETTSEGTALNEAAPAEAPSDESTAQLDDTSSNDQTTPVAEAPTPSNTEQ